MIAVVAATLAFLASYGLGRLTEHATGGRSDKAGAVFIASSIALNAALIALV